MNMYVYLSQQSNECIYQYGKPYKHTTSVHGGNKFLTT
jgi:hypothetical protein